MSISGISITITIDAGATPEQLDQAFQQLSRMLAAATPPPAQPAAGASTEVRDRVRAAVLDAPDGVTPPELSQRIQTASADSPKIDFSDHKKITSGAQSKRRTSNGQAPPNRFSITHEELDALGSLVTERLTEKEHQAIRLVADGLSTVAIAAQMACSDKSVYQSVRRARDKLARPLDAPVKRRGRPRKLAAPPILNEGSVRCPLCDANRTALHVEQHRIQNEREKARQAAGRASISKLSRPSGVGGAT